MQRKTCCQQPTSKAIVNSTPTTNTAIKAPTLPTGQPLLNQSLANHLPQSLAQQARTFKTVEVLHLRCGSCRFVRVKGIMCVLCEKHPRHKQRQPGPRLNE